MKITLRNYWIGLGLILFLAFVIRFVNIDGLPPSPYWEEAAIGYDAYSIALTGKDHHGNSYPVVAFESFGDWKPSTYFYAVALVVKFIGLNLTAVRLPSVIAGLFIVVGVAELTRYFFLLFETKIKNEQNVSHILGLIAGTITAVSPWAIIFSRGGWEVNLATAFIVWAGVSAARVKHCLKYKDYSSQRELTCSMLAAIFLAIATYAYQGTRITAPLLGLIFAGWWLYGLSKDKIKLYLPTLLISGFVALVLLMPLVTSLGNPQFSQRFSETSIFSNLEIIKESNQRKEKAGNSFLSRIIYHRYLLYGKEIATNFLDHTNLSFLFLNGDQNPRHSIQYYGQLYHIEAIFLIAGIYAITKWKREILLVILAWYIVAVLPASLTKTTPHALRTLPSLPILLMLITFGIYQIWHQLTKLSKKMAFSYVLAVFVMGLYMAEFLGFWRYYQFVYPQAYASEWQYGYQRMVEVVNQQLSENPDTKVYITREQGRPAMYYWFYSQTDPSRVQAANSFANKDQGEFLEFENIEFVNTVAEIVETPAIVASSRSGFETAGETESIEKIDTVYRPDGKIVWEIYKLGWK